MRVLAAWVWGLCFPEGLVVACVTHGRLQCADASPVNAVLYRSASASLTPILESLACCFHGIADTLAFSQFQHQLAVLESHSVPRHCCGESQPWRHAHRQRVLALGQPAPASPVLAVLN